MKSPYQDTDWSLCDTDIARMMGVSRAAVGKARRRHSALKTDCKRRVELDDDGYPTKRTLRNIARWDWRDALGMMTAIKPLWKYMGWKEESVVDSYLLGVNATQFSLATAGWSGNGSIITALQANKMFWAMCWHMSQRGGLHVFRVRIVEQ